MLDVTSITDRDTVPGNMNPDWLKLPADQAVVSYIPYTKFGDIFIVENPLPFAEWYSKCVDPNVITLFEFVCDISATEQLLDVPAVAAAIADD